LEAKGNSLRTTAIIPVKRLDSAHSRLADVLSKAQRSAVAQALFLDTLSKLRRCRKIDEILVVTADPWVMRHARWLGHEVLEQTGDLGHSEAAIAGTKKAMADGAERVAMLPIDCPLLDPADLDRHLSLTPRAVIVPDRHHTGTNALMLAPPDAFEPAFGPESLSRHIARARAAGVGFTLPTIDSLAFDLDTPEDLAELRDRLLLDPRPAHRTAQVLWEVGAMAEAGSEAESESDPAVA
jgi:2-phospho-L-lactate guanylyltransferase